AAGIVRAVKNGTMAKAELDGARLEKLHAVLGDDADLAALISEMNLLFRPVLRLDGKDNAWADSDITLEGTFTVETWIKLDSGIDNNDGILGVPGVLDMNFYGGHFRVWIGGTIQDAIVAKKKINGDVWTHVAVTREGNGALRIYQNGELDTDQGKLAPQKFEHCRIAWTGPAQGTAGWLNEYRVWNRARTADEIRADFDRSFEGDAKPLGLVHYFSATNWNKLQDGAKVMQTLDFPPLMNAAEAKALAEKFSKFRALAKMSGDITRGKTLFSSICMSCHSVGGQGGQVGPVLSGAGASGVEALLRNLLTPSAAMEAGYRVFRVEMLNDDVLDGILVSQEKDAMIIRRPNTEDTRIASKEVRRAEFMRRSMMPDGLLDTITLEEVTDLFAYLQTLK
ncbi:MAG: LamG-like jellyroll fold domain-containing protein, partial [Verrucomicrobiota bacterium]